MPHSKILLGFGLVVIVLISVACATSGNVFSLDVGDCFDDPDIEADRISDVARVDCVSPHDSEVYAVFDIAGARYPGHESVVEIAQQGCGERFAEYVGSPLESSLLAATFLAPTEQSWENSDDREVICYLLDRGRTKLEGSMRGSAA